MTLTYPVLNRSRRIIWLVTGGDKAQTLARLYAGDDSIPAGRVRRDRALVLAARAAAAAPGTAPSPRITHSAQAAGHEIIDFGADKMSSDDDYPDFVVPLAQAVAAGTVDRGVAVCGSGVGGSVGAKKNAGGRGGGVRC